MKWMKIIGITLAMAVGLIGCRTSDASTQEETAVQRALEHYEAMGDAERYGVDAVSSASVVQPGNTAMMAEWIQDAGYEKTMRSFEKTPENFGTDYLDLYLIHMPYGDYYESWKVMEELYRKGKIRATGVCNFLPDRLVDLILNMEVVPAVNQIELHPFCQQENLRNVMEQYQIQPMAWAPFAEGQKDIFRNPILTEIGAKYQKSAAQVILRWLRQSDIVAIPKSVHAERIQENFAIDDFELTEVDRREIQGMDIRSSLILEIQSLEEVYRLKNIQFVQ